MSNGVTYPATTPLMAFIQQQEGQVGYYPIFDNNWNPSFMVYYTGPLLQATSPLSSPIVPVTVLTRVKR